MKSSSSFPVSHKTTNDCPLLIDLISTPEAPVLCRVSVIAYDCTPTSDGKTSRLQEAVKTAGGTWKNVAKMSEQALAKRVRDDRVDILVELTGHTANNRLGVMAQRPAPVQVRKSHKDEV